MIYVNVQYISVWGGHYVASLHDVMKKTLSPIQDEGKNSGGSSDGIDPSVTLRTVKESLGNLVELQQVHKERLRIIEEELTKLQKFQKDYEQLLKRLQTLPDKTTHEVMVPFGKLAFMPGHLVHTNEILVLLGDNWFADRSAKQASDIVRRRLKDCDEKIKMAEASRKIHTNWLKEAEEVMTGEAGNQMDILEELTEDEFQRSQEEHRKKVTKYYAQLREEERRALRSSESDPTPGTSTLSEDSCTSSIDERFANNLTEKDRQTYEDLMKRLDQLALQEDEDTDGSDETEESDNDQEISVAGEEKKVKFDAQISDSARTINSDGAEIAHETLLSKRAKLKRRVSWADDVRPLYTVIPDDESEDIYRIKYSSGPLSLPLEPPGAEGVDTADGGVESIQSPSDIYKVFGLGASGPEPPPRGILKKSTSLPAQGDNSDVQDGWCCPPKPLDIDSETPEDLPPPPPSPPPKRMHSIKPAFSYRVLEHKSDKAEALDDDDTTKTEEQPKKVSKFKAARMKK
ncbi:unconventional prefoldin RPB5 interactor 1-like isoform X1 [Homarus americanus]|uniref:unconventional prefoldin RPB5 interactor 1-like isoform X1 n=2 Tax=Homarus americanus TaxID=6706 RepID=UPI001C44523E|nr:unconventional prefoldin RPB5 interactor 1-like isoform X1 [Homarus americanus]